MSNDNSSIAQSIVRSNIYLTLATSDGENAWSSPVFYCFDEDFNFYFISKPDSRHIQNIMKNPSVSFSIFDSHQPEGEGNGVQGSGKVTVLEDDRLIDGLLYYKTSFIKLTADNLTGDAPYRLFKLVPEKWFTLDPDAETDERIKIEM